MKKEQNTGQKEWLKNKNHKLLVNLEMIIMINLNKKNQINPDIQMMIIIMIGEAIEEKDIKMKRYMLKNKNQKFNHKYMIKIVKNNIVQKPKNNAKKYLKIKKINT